MNRRAAFTLVELLVVAGIFAMLFGMVLNGARPTATGQVKQAAQSIASVLLATQSKALGKPAGAGVIFDPAGGGAAVATVSAADMLPLITGSCTNGMPPTNLADTTASVTIAPDNADAADLAHGYKIRFHEEEPAAQAPTAWMEFKSSASSVVSFRTGNGQTTQNTIWPKPANGGPLKVTIARYPNEGETLYELPKAAAIDLRYSGIGDGTSFSTNWSNLSGKGALAVAFDSVGEVDAVMQQVLSAATARTVQPLAPTQPIYLLVAARADVEAGANTLASSTSLWVVIHPQTGRVSVSSNVPQAATDATALRNARANARAGLAIGK
jgi:type II secretory pathway pseudopilin PulG